MFTINKLWKDNRSKKMCNHNERHMYIWRQAHLFANQIRIIYKCVSWKLKKKEEIFVINEEQRSNETLGIVITTALQMEKGLK